MLQIKSKIALIVLLLITIIGSISAYKSNNTKALYFQDPINQQCTIKKTGITILEGCPFKTRVGLSPTTAPCPLTICTTTAPFN